MYHRSRQRSIARIPLRSRAIEGDWELLSGQLSLTARLQVTIFGSYLTAARTTEFSTVRERPEGLPFRYVSPLLKRANRLLTSVDGRDVLFQCAVYAFSCFEGALVELTLRLK